jgi:hypothetical protein
MFVQVYWFSRDETVKVAVGIAKDEIAQEKFPRRLKPHFQMMSLWRG